MRLSNSGRAVHPHSRGENIGDTWEAVQNWGSSPLARGKCLGHLHTSDLRRFIPTRAGKMPALRYSAFLSGVHPHSRGENKAEHCPVCHETGSSPLARGKSLKEPAEPLSGRFIPTRAGKILCEGVPGTLSRVHPHSRGENLFYPKLRRRRMGSSPLARGKSDLDRPFGRSRGFIPTRAGKIS